MAEPHPSFRPPSTLKHAASRQVIWSSRNPAISWRLPLVHKWLYLNRMWSYLCTVLTTMTFLVVPFLSLMFDLQPVKFSRQFALAATLYLSANFLVSGAAPAASQEC